MNMIFANPAEGKNERCCYFGYLRNKWDARIFNRAFGGTGFPCLR